MQKCEITISKLCVNDKLPLACNSCRVPVSYAGINHLILGHRAHGEVEFLDPATGQVSKKLNDGVLTDLIKPGPKQELAGPVEYYVPPKPPEEPKILSDKWFDTIADSLTELLRPLLYPSEKTASQKEAESKAKELISQINLPYFIFQSKGPAATNRLTQVIGKIATLSPEQYTGAALVHNVSQFAEAKGSKLFDGDIYEYKQVNKDGLFSLFNPSPTGPRQILVIQGIERMFLDPAFHEASRKHIGSLLEAQSRYTYPNFCIMGSLDLASPFLGKLEESHKQQCLTYFNWLTSSSTHVLNL